MTEREFRSHVEDMAEYPDADERAAYYAHLTATLLNAIASSPWLGVRPFSDEVLNPWARPAAPGEMTTREMAVVASLAGGESAEVPWGAWKEL